MVTLNLNGSLAHRTIVSICMSITLICSWTELSAQDLEGKFYPLSKSGISLYKPEGFELSQDFEGFINLQIAGTIITQESDQNVSMVLMNYTRASLSEQNMQLINREQVTLTNGKEGVLFTTRFILNGNLEFERLILVTGDFKHTIIIMGNYPAQVKEQWGDEIRRSLLTAQY